MTNTPHFTYKFTTIGQPFAVMIWAIAESEPKHPRAEKLESGMEAVHVRWPSSILFDFDCDAPHKVASSIATAVSGYIAHRRTSEDYAAFEAAMLEWLMECRREAALAAEES